MTAARARLASILRPGIATSLPCLPASLLLLLLLLLLLSCRSTAAATLNNSLLLAVSRYLHHSRCYNFSSSLYLALFPPPPPPLSLSLSFALPPFFFHVSLSLCVPHVEREVTERR